MRYRLGDGMVDDPFTGGGGSSGGSGASGTFDPISGQSYPGPRASQSDVRTVDNAIFASQAQTQRGKGAGFLIGAFLLAPLLLGMRRKRR